MPNRKLNLGEKVYHRSSGLPKGIHKQFGRQIAVSYTGHAQLECRRDSLFPNFDLPEVVTVTEHNLIEVTLDVLGRPAIFLLREPVPETDYDRTLVVNPYRGIVVTCWANRWDDHHPDLDLRFYTEGEVFLDAAN